MVAAEGLSVLRKLVMNIQWLPIEESALARVFMQLVLKGAFIESPVSPTCRMCILWSWRVVVYTQSRKDNTVQ